MKPSLPIKALLVFDTVMRYNSFTLAAEALNVTTGAVGQQIQKLEEWLGTPLFIRTIRQIKPTADALNYWAAIQPALSRIQQASDALRVKQVNEVCLSMPPSLAATWFAPRMADFLSFRPDVSLHLSASTSLVDFERDRADLAIRYFDGDDRDLDSTLLYHGEARLYCTPEYAKTHRLQTPDDLIQSTLLHTTLASHWVPWLKRFSTLTGAQIDAIPTQSFDSSMQAIEAARCGHGVFLSHAILTQREVRAGTLCEPFDVQLPLTKGYFLVHHRKGVLRPAAVVLKQWLLDGVAADRL